MTVSLIKDTRRMWMNEVDSVNDLVGYGIVFKVSSLIGKLPYSSLCVCFDFFFSRFTAGVFSLIIRGENSAVSP